MIFAATHNAPELDPTATLGRANLNRNMNRLRFHPDMESIQFAFLV